MKIKNDLYCYKKYHELDILKNKDTVSGYLGDVEFTHDDTIECLIIANNTGEYVYIRDDIMKQIIEEKTKELQLQIEHYKNAIILFD